MSTKHLERGSVVIDTDVFDRIAKIRPIDEVLDAPSLQAIVLALKFGLTAVANSSFTEAPDQQTHQAEGCKGVFIRNLSPIPTNQLTNLLNCDASIYGEMIWSTNVSYWLSHSYPVVYANLLTAWFFGETNVTFRGYGQGVL
jgi:hypothetical protein